MVVPLIQINRDIINLAGSPVEACLPGPLLDVRPDLREALCFSLRTLMHACTVTVGALRLIEGLPLRDLWRLGVGRQHNRDQKRKGCDP
jgi:hypothetical protein